VDHRGHVELAQLLVERVPVLVDQRRIGPHAAGGIGVEVDADEAELVHHALELRDAVPGRHAGELRQLPDADEVVRQELADAVDEVVADACPFLAQLLGADVMRHAAGPRREHRQVAAALALETDLRLHAPDQHLVADAEVGGTGTARRVRQPRELLVAECVQRRRLGGVVAVDVNDHG
jgi:hypothetical protein